MTFIFKGFSALSTFSLLIFANTFLLNQPALAKGQITDVYRHKSRNSQYSIVDAAKKDQSSVRIADACPGNGDTAASAYNLGVLLGLAAFQSSVNQPGLASDAFGMAQDQALIFTGTGHTCAKYSRL